MHTHSLNWGTTHLAQFGSMQPMQPIQPTQAMKPILKLSGVIIRQIIEPLTSCLFRRKRKHPIPILPGGLRAQFSHTA